MEKLLKTIDLFPYNFGLTFKNQKRFQTEFGGCVSIIYLILILICAFVFSENLRERMDPKLVSTESLYHENNILDNVTNDNFIFGMFLEKFNPEVIINEELFALKAIYEDENKIKHDIKFRSCKEIYGKNHSLHQIWLEHNKYLNNGTCLDLSSLSNNTKVEPFKTGFHLEIKCKKEKNSNCLYNKELRKLLLNTLLEIFTYDTLLHSNNLSMPFTKNMYTSGIMVNSEFEKLITLEYEAYQVESDLGFFFKDTLVQSDLNLDLLDKQYRLNNYDPDYNGDIIILSIDILFTNKLRYVKRIYSKIQDVFAGIAGIMNILAAMGKITVGIYSSFAFDQELINSIFKKKLLDETIFIKKYNLDFKDNNKISNKYPKQSSNDVKANINITQGITKNYDINDASSSINDIEKYFDNSCMKNLKNVGKNSKSGLTHDNKVLPSSNRFILGNESEKTIIETKRKSDQDQELKDINIELSDKKKCFENKNRPEQNLPYTESKTSNYKLYIKDGICKHESLNFSFTELLRVCIFNQNKLQKHLQEKHKLFNVYVNELSSTKEIDKLIEMQFKFDFFQFILLEEHQRYAFQHIMYLSIYQKDRLEKTQDEEIMKLYTVEKHYKELLAKEANSSSIDKKIYSNLDQELISLFGLK